MSHCYPVGWVCLSVVLAVSLLDVGPVRAGNPEPPQEIAEWAKSSPGELVSASGSFELFLAKPKKSPGGFSEAVALLEEFNSDTSSADVRLLDSASVGAAPLDMHVGDMPTPRALPFGHPANAINQQIQGEFRKQGNDKYTRENHRSALAAASSIANQASAAIAAAPTSTPEQKELQNKMNEKANYIKQVAAVTSGKANGIQQAVNQQNEAMAKAKEGKGKQDSAARLQQYELQKAQSNEDHQAAQALQQQIAGFDGVREQNTKRMMQMEERPDGIQTGYQTLSLHPLSPEKEKIAKASVSSSQAAWNATQNQVANAEVALKQAQDESDVGKESESKANIRVQESQEVVGRRDLDNKKCKETLAARNRKMEGFKDQLADAKSDKNGADSEASKAEALAAHTQGTPSHAGNLQRYYSAQAAQKRQADTEMKIKKQAADAENKVSETARQCQRTQALYEVATRGHQADRNAQATEQKKAGELRSKQAGKTKALQDAEQMLEFAKLHNLGLKPGVCCKQANAKENMACLTCRCSVPDQLREANAHCLSCKPGHIFLQDVSGAGTCQEWDSWKRVYSDESKTSVACPLYPYQITKMQNPNEAFACYRWGWFKERILAPANQLEVEMFVRPICKAMKQSVCGPEQPASSSPELFSRHCTVSKSAKCSELWIESNSIIEYFKTMNKVIKDAATPPKRSQTAKAKGENDQDEDEDGNNAEQEESNMPPTAPATSMADLGEAVDGPSGADVSGENSDSESSELALTASRAEPVDSEKGLKELSQKAEMKKQNTIFIEGKCRAMGGTVRSMTDSEGVYCAVDCNPEDPTLREMLALPGTKWDTSWRSGNWCEPTTATI